MGCMPEFSRCELNRAGLESPFINSAETNPELAFGIGVCNPEHARSPCCTSNADCKGYGEECCDKFRLQCVPEQGNDPENVMQNIVCIK
mmetsp:Transcript_2489/g.5272  ORF Transcript_2489/g.5272 Transcript_2489/m.5272 type:complete len:89 (-) Transcript_2489:55-321(-)